MTAQGSAYMRLRRALDRGNVTEAFSAAAELQVVGLTEALELTLFVLTKEPAKYERLALRFHARLVNEVGLELRKAPAALGLLAAIPVTPGAALGLAELLGLRRQTRLAETLVAWSREA